MSDPSRHTPRPDNSPEREGVDSGANSGLPASSIGDDLGLGITVPGSRLIDAEGHRKVHPISPLVHAVAVFPALAGIAFAVGIQRINTLAGRLDDLIGLAWMPPIALAIIVFAVIAFLLSALVAALNYFQWRALSFWFDDDGDFRMQSGVLFRQQRRVQLSRIQTVDVTQPFAARLFSMAVVVIEVAGQDDSRVRLKYVTLDDAREIRREVLARSAGLSATTAEAPQSDIARVSGRHLAVSLALRMTTAGLLLLTVIIIVTSYLTGGWGAIGVAVVTGGIPVVLVVAEFIRYYGFTVAQSPDGLRLRYGLLRTESRTVPPGRVQAIEYVEPLLWRRQRWTRIRVTIAGVGSESSGSGSQRSDTVLIPVSEMDAAQDIVSRVLPDLRASSITWVGAPRRASWRSPIQWRTLAVGWDAHSFAIRRGRITRRTALVPHARTQSVRWTQGPWERVLDLASVHVDTTPGPVSVSGLHLDASATRTVAHLQAAAADRGRRTDTSLHWAAP